MHNLGGITRKIRLIAVPTVSISDIHTLVKIDPAQPLSRPASVSVNVAVANDAASADSEDVAVAVVMCPYTRGSVVGCPISCINSTKSSFQIPPVAAMSRANGTTALQVNGFTFR